MTHLSNRAGSSREEMAAYSARLRRLGGEDPLAALEAFAVRLGAAVSGLTRAEVVAPESDGRWSVLQVLEHLADHEMIVGYRIRMILAHDEPEIQGFDQDLWAERLHWQQRGPEESIADFTAMRRRNLRLLRSLSKEELARAGIHRERGPETVRQLVELTAGHDLAHLAQIERIISARHGG